MRTPYPQHVVRQIPLSSDFDGHCKTADQKRELVEFAIVVLFNRIGKPSKAFVIA